MMQPNPIDQDAGGQWMVGLCQPAGERQAPAGLLQKDSVLLEFSLNKYLPAGLIESRELGLIVSSIALEPK